MDKLYISQKSDGNPIINLIANLTKKKHAVFVMKK